MSLPRELADELMRETLVRHKMGLCWPGTEWITEKIEKALERAAQEAEKQQCAGEDCGSTECQMAGKIAESIRRLKHTPDREMSDYFEDLEQVYRDARQMKDDSMELEKKLDRIIELLELCAIPHDNPASQRMWWFKDEADRKRDEILNSYLRGDEVDSRELRQAIVLLMRKFSELVREHEWGYWHPYLPHDSHYLFKDFVKMMEEWKGK